MSKNSFVIFPVFSLLFASIIQIGEPHTRAGGLGYQDPPCIGNRTVILEVLYIHVFYIFGSFKVLLKKSSLDGICPTLPRSVRNTWDQLDTVLFSFFRSMS